jgi:hypothetical protein
MVPCQRPPSTSTTNYKDVPQVPPASTTAPQAANQREEAVQGRGRYRSPGSRVRRLTPRDSSGRFSGGGSWAEIIFRPPISGRSQLTPERRWRRLRLATPTRSAAAYARLRQGFPGMSRLGKGPAYAGVSRLLDTRWTNAWRFPPEPPLPLHCTQDSRDSHRLPHSMNDGCPHYVPAWLARLRAGPAKRPARYT